MADSRSLAGQGIVLFAHGSRDPLWRGPIEAVARRIAQLAPQVPVACAYLELTEPDLGSAVADLLARQRLEQITVVPMFLGMGRHAREDLPRLLQALRVRHPDVRFTQQGAIGEDARLTELMARIALS